MKFKVKIIIFLMLVALISNLMATAILYSNTKKIIKAEMKSKIVSVVATTAAFLDTDLIEKFRENPKDDDDNYLLIREVLFKALNANKRRDFVISFMYIFQKPLDNNLIIVEIDTKTKEQRIEAGHELVRSQEFLKDEELEQIGGYSVTKTFYKNSFGVWLSAFSPIKDADNNIIGYLGINVRGSNVIKYLNQILIYCLVTLFISIVIAFILALILAKKFSDPLHSLCHTVEEIGKGNLIARCEYSKDDEFGKLGHEIDKMADGLEERDKIKSIFARYVSKEVLDLILKKSEKAKLEGERKKITVLFSDLRQFSKISEKLPPEEVVEILNHYFKEMIEIVFKYRGTLDKILGDGLMIIFGAPLDDENQEMNATNAAIEMHQALNKLNQEWEKQNKTPLKMGIGIHTGEAIVGNVGSEKHLEYTAIGVTVNFANSIEQATKKYNCPILISNTIAEKIQNIPLEDHGNFEYNGKAIDLKIYSVKG
jgi:adenylate cyclase